MFKKQAKKFEFTDVNIKKLNRPKDVSMVVYSDTVAPRLVCVVYRDVKHKIYAHLYNKKMKMIARTDEISVEDARSIAYNINENYDEFLNTHIAARESVAEDIKQHGFFPRNKRGTEVILSDENSSLKDKIKELSETVRQLQKENLEMKELLNEINHARRSYLNSLRRIDLMLGEE